MSLSLVSAKVMQVMPLTDSIVQVILSPEQYVNYQAGQYLQIVTAAGSYSYSIANAPLGSHNYELHIRHSVDNLVTRELLNQIREQGLVQINVPLGQCHIHQLETYKPTIFIAAGTGFAPIKAMIEQLLANDDSRRFELYWGARNMSDLYFNTQVSHWHQHAQHFEHLALLPDMRKDTLGPMVIERHGEDLSQWQIVLSGPFDFVYQTRDYLLAHGAQQHHLFSDAFYFEERQ